MKRALVAATFAVLVASALQAATISGTILDPGTQDWNPVPGATVIAVHPTTGKEIKTSTNGLGKYSLNGLPPNAKVKMKFSKTNHLRDPQEHTAQTSTGNVVVDEYLARRGGNQQYFREFARNLVEAHSAADLTKANSLYQIYKSLPKEIKKIVDDEQRRLNFDVERNHKAQKPNGRLE